jgi:hypothetical protein
MFGFGTDQRLTGRVASLPVRTIADAMGRRDESLQVTSGRVESGIFSREPVASPLRPGAGTGSASRKHCHISNGAFTMAITAAANDMFVRQASNSLKCGESGIDIPKGHTGPVLMSDTGRTVWWTGRVAIGLRYEAPRHGEAHGQSALWIQNVLLRCA